MTYDKSFYKGKRVLITGHTGFKGSWLLQMLLMAGAEVTGYALAPEGETLYSLCHFETACKEGNAVTDSNEHDNIGDDSKACTCGSAGADGSKTGNNVKHNETGTLNSVIGGGDFAADRMKQTF